jgi:acetylxylan esterase
MENLPMARNRVTLGAWLAATAGVLAAPSANAASLQPVSNWGASGMPSDVSMYIYVPDKVATNPPILTLVHYCGGTASNVFGQAQGGGVVKAADQYGFIMVVPSSGRCWDVQSDKTRTRDGGGDSHAIKQMVKYAIDKYQANADRVYSTGDSSGGMMTELLLAVYPDVFKAGAAFAGMPAGCRAANESGSGGGYSGACAGGSVTHTPQEWGDIVRKMDPGYTGHLPRVQLFHGDSDTTIRYANHTEAIKEWTNVLGLSTDPTSTETGVKLGDHQAKRQKWQNPCGYVVLDAFTSIGGDHGPSDALFKAEYVIPFLGLDKTGPLDPEIEECGGRTDGGAGAAGAGGRTGAKDAGGSGDTGGGGRAGSGGRAGFGGGAGGGSGNGGSGGRSSTSSEGGGQGSGGTHGTGGRANAGNASGGSATAGSRDIAGVAGSSLSGERAGNRAGNTSNENGEGGAAGGSGDGDDLGPNGGGCALAKVPSNKHVETGFVALGLALATFARKRRRRMTNDE